MPVNVPNLCEARTLTANAAASVFVCIKTHTTIFLCALKENNICFVVFLETSIDQAQNPAMNLAKRPAISLAISLAMIIAMSLAMTLEISIAKNLTMRIVRNLAISLAMTLEKSLANSFVIPFQSVSQKYWQ